MVNIATSKSLPILLFWAMLVACSDTNSAEKGMLKIITDPGDARVFIDGKPKGNSPELPGQSLAVKLVEGEYVISAQKDDGIEHEWVGEKRGVYLAADSMQTVNLQLDRKETKAGKLVREAREQEDKLAKYAKEGKAKLEAEPIIKKLEQEMIAIPGGSFQMGCVSGQNCMDYQNPVYTVTLKSFELSKHEITFEQWDACFAQGGCSHLPEDDGWGRGNRPVIKVSWDDIQIYIAWLNQQTSKTYRLPSEAEWEYAARAGTTTEYAWGNDVGKNNANCWDCGSQWDGKQTAPVGSFKANTWGLFDMHGNVREWVQDCWNDSYTTNAPKDGTAWEQGDCSQRVLRGGSWVANTSYLRAANRSHSGRVYRHIINGFRLARTL